MTELLTAAQMRAIEAAAIASGKVTGLELMERAGQGVVDAIFAQWPELAPAASGERGPAPVAKATPPEYFGQDDGKALRAVVLCGPGNNGGDGFVVARLLKDAGWDVDVFLYGDAGKLPPDARVNYERWEGPIVDFAVEADAVSAQMMQTDLIVDALFGTGLTRSLSGPEENFWPIYDRMPFLDQLEANGRTKTSRLVSIDMPSGVCADCGRVLAREEKNSRGVHLEGMFAHADLTIAFHRFKLGHFLIGENQSHQNGVQLSGKLVLCDIGIPETPMNPERYKNTVTLVAGNRFGLSKSFGLKQIAHKYGHGHAFILSGGVGKGGAARLAARGALRVGAGLVTLGVPPAALIENAAQLNTVMLAKVKGAEALDPVLADKRINAFCAGPGFGTGSREKALLAAILDAGPQRYPGGQSPRNVVLDADALTILVSEPALFAKLHACCVLTPHGGEFARLFPDIAEKLSAPATKGPAYSKVDAVRDAAVRAGCVVLYKGPDTVIAAPDGQCSINASVYERSAPWLATAGSGDVLAGFITGLLARGFGPMQAAETGAWLHTECALSFGPGLIAEDLPEALPKVLSRLLGDAG